MVRRPIIAAIFLLAAAYCAPAQAGLISVEGASAFAAATIDDPAPDAQQPAPDRPEIKRLDEEAANLETSGGMSGTVVVTSGGSPPPAILSSATDVAPRMVSRLAPERRVWLPPPFFTGVFRPPRTSR